MLSELSPGFFVHWCILIPCFPTDLTVPLPCKMRVGFDRSSVIEAAWEDWRSDEVPPLLIILEE
jgi:hypothetical protein